ncbi:hypothetical protein PtA15_13A282 [Puccinia triticina]|uniref:Uncharacterized protein n=1 Tax=Puccinia triticina TaxID=208348 RepID=A0ABY7D7I5_9BASI|nr:uncharacterized protein PtA15_13A282 [Puccinia triticina]WAQ90882.1 hypothetical protein PtA15_13A282 [Puccinia triticina]
MDTPLSPVKQTPEAGSRAVEGSGARLMMSLASILGCIPLVRLVTLAGHTFKGSLDPGFAANSPIAPLTSSALGEASTSMQRPGTGLFSALLAIINVASANHEPCLVGELSQPPYPQPAGLGFSNDPLQQNQHNDFLSASEGDLSFPTYPGSYGGLYGGFDPQGLAHVPEASLTREPFHSKNCYLSPPVIDDQVTQPINGEFQTHNTYHHPLLESSYRRLCSTDLQTKILAVSDQLYPQTPHCPDISQATGPVGGSTLGLLVGPQQQQPSDVAVLSLYSNKYPAQAKLNRPGLLSVNKPIKLDRIRSPANPKIPKVKENFSSPSPSSSKANGKRKANEPKLQETDEETDSESDQSQSDQSPDEAPPPAKKGRGRPRKAIIKDAARRLKDM